MKHNWNTRRCIKFQRYSTAGRAQAAAHYLDRFHNKGPTLETRCPWCGAWHLVSPGIARYLGYRGTVEFLADLPPLFAAPAPADPSRSNGSYARKYVRQQ